MKDILGKQHAAIIKALDQEQDPTRERLKEGPAHADALARIARELKAVEDEKDREKSGQVICQKL